ncbi:MAG TPA: molecular chaperone HtpG, partial [Eubacteriaceae bacterium]|nr:molecular chaperone HtpG [Eubacteriaceae bacterium]
YEMEACEKDGYGTVIEIELSDNTEEENYDEYLESFRLENIIKKYSDFIRYPILLPVEEVQPKEDGSEETETVVKEKTVNTMVPIWKKDKSELTEEDYTNFYHDKHYGFDDPLKTIHFQVDGMISYRALLFIPEKTPFDYYTKEYEKGLELYSSGVMIMEKSPDLLPDYFSFVKGLVDSEDLSLNISREMLQHNRQLQRIAKNIKDKIKRELLSLLKKDREKYEAFFDSFGRQLKFGVYSDFGANKEDLQDLLLFKSSKDKAYVTLKEYVERMKEDQKSIYYASGESIEKIEKSPQIEKALDKGYEVLFFTDEVDEFAINMLGSYEEKEFKSVASGEDFLDEEEKDEIKNVQEEKKDMLEKMKS